MPLHNPLRSAGDDTSTRTRTRTKVARPPLYKVMLLNDDFTPREFVVMLLKAEFHMSEDQALIVMITAHKRGACVVAVFTREVAETKVAQVNEYSRMNQHPLLCTMEKA